MSKLFKSVGTAKPDSTNSQIIVTMGDITKYLVDVIVNSANHKLNRSGGVNGAIYKMAGNDLQKEAKKFKGIKPGQAFLTNAYNLPSNYVIHTLGPKWAGGKNDEEKTLTECYRNCMHLAAGIGLETIALPNISTGAFNYPKKEAAIIAINTIGECISEMFNWDIQVFIVCYEESNRLWTSNAIDNYKYYKGVHNAI